MTTINTPQKPVKSAALALLARQPYTARRLADKLSQKGYPESEIGAILEWCAETGYVNDAEWAVRAAERKAAKSWDRRKIYAYLRSYGITRADAEDALRTIKSDTSDYWFDDSP